MQNSLVFLAAILYLFPHSASSFCLSFMQSSTSLWELKTLPESLSLSPTLQHLCVSQNEYSAVPIHPEAWLVAHSTSLDPPHYGQQIAALTETHFKGSACRLFCLDKHTCQSSVLGYESVMGLWYYGPQRQQTAACLLPFTCAETKHMALRV